MSSNKFCGSLLISLIILIATAFTATAFSEDFMAFSTQENITACACDLVQDSMFIQNKGSITSTYILNTQGEAAGWSTQAPDTFYLEQSERKEIKNFINVPCYARGQYELTTNITTLFGLEKTLRQNIEVENCANVQLLQKSGTQETCPCSPSTYEFEIINTGKHTESYRINVTPYNEYVTVSDPILILEPGQSHTIYAFLNLPCDVYGKQEFSLNALAEGTGILGQMKFEHGIDACYDYRLEAEDEYDVCLNVPNIVPIDITNLVDIANKYHLTIDGPTWARFNNDTMFAWGKQKTVANLILEPKTGMTENMTETYEITVNAVTERGKIEESENITVHVDNCYDLNVILKETDVHGITGQAAEYGALLHNTGSKESTYLLEVFGPEWALLNETESTITLYPDETKEVHVTTYLPLDTTAQQDVSIVGTITNLSIVRSNSFRINPVTIEDAYRLDIEVKDKTISYAGDVIEVPVTNMGVKESEFVAFVTAPSWVLVENTEFTLAPGDNTTIMLNAAPTEDVIDDKYAINVEITPRGTGVYYTTSFLLGVSEKTFWGQVMENWLLILLIALPIILLLIVLIIFLIVKRSREKEQFKEDLKERKVELEKVHTEEKKEVRQEKEPSRWWIWPIIILIIIGLVAGGAFLAGKMLPPAKESNETISEGSPVVEPVTEAATEHTQKETEETGYVGIITDPQGIIEIDRRAVPGTGNVLEVKEPVQMALDIEVTNPTDKNVVFDLKADNDEQSWITFPNSQLYISPEGKAKTNIIITPDMEVLREADYNVSVGVSLKGEKIDYQQSIDLIVHKKKSFSETWWFWILIGLVAAVAVILVIASLRNIKDDDEPKARKEPSRWWVIPLVVVVIILIVGGLALGGWHLSKNISAGDNETVDDTPVETKTTTETTSEIPPDSIIQVDLTGFKGAGNEVVLDKIEPIKMNMTVYNPSSERALFTARTSESSWLSVEEPSIELAPKSAYQTQLIITPDNNVLKKQDYAVSVNSSLEGVEGKVNYTQTLSLVLKKENKWHESMWFYVLVGIIVAIIVIAIIFGTRKKEEGDYEYFFGEEDEEIPKKEKKKRTKLKLDKK